jgi:hypothetical protein
VPAKEKSWVATNADRSAGLPVISQKGTPLPTAEARKKELGF